MSRRRSREAVAPSLFPFLAVLLCTMGSLVLILMLIVSGAQASARKIADEVVSRKEEAEATLELAAASYSRQLEDGQFEVEKQRLMLQHFEEHIRELLDELATLEEKSKLLDSEKETDASEIEAQREAITELEKQLAEAEEDLKQKLAKPDGDKPIFAVIPYQGSNGTLRRPIYVECVNNGILIQPEGIFLSEQDLQPPHGPGNPLDAALRAIRSEYRPEKGAINEAAYPLLIVRPSGIRSYTYARSAMNGWDDQFGYELISEDLELVYPQTKPGLKEKVTQTVELARSRQSALVAAMPRKYKGFSNLRGGSGGSGSGNARLAGNGGGNGISSGASGTYSGSTLQNQSSFGGGLAGGQNGNSQFGSGGSYGGAGSQLLDPGSFESGSNRTGAGNENGLEFFGSNGSATGESGSLFANNGSIGQKPGSQGTNTAGGFGSGTPDSLTQGSGTQGSGTQGSGRQGSGKQGESTSEFGASGEGVPEQTGGLLADGSNGQFSGAAGKPTAENGGGSTGSGETAGGGSAGGGSGSQSASSGGSSSGGARAANSNMAGNPGAAAQADQSGAGAPSLNAQFGQNGRNENASAVAQTRGRNWAWSRGPATQTPVVRSIHLHCFSDRWVLISDDGNPSRGTTITFEKAPEDRAVALAKAIQKRVDGWGLALTGGYWRPVLVVDVSPKAKWRFDQLRQLMEGSGIEIKLRQPSP